MKKIFKIALYAILGIVVLVASFVCYSILVMKINEKRTDSGGTWNPKQALVAYASKATGDFEIYTISLDEKTETRTTFNDKSDDLYPSFSPNGEWIAYISSSNGETDLYLMDVK
ncbi:MAG: hypothetical protein RIA63_12135, partial [Cyclobacteriaceae bacterium]